MSKAIAIKSCATREEAELLKSMLEAHGISAMVDVDEYPGLPLQTSGGVQLRVLQEDVEQAQRILQESKNAE
jgi:hypothetical protein